MKNTLIKKPIREKNRHLILNLIRKSGSISRVKLAAETGLSTAALTKITSQLLDHGLIREIGLGESSQGRKPILLELNYKACHIIGIDVGRISIRACLTDLSGQILVCKKRDYDLQNNWQQVHQEIVNQVIELQDEVPSLPSPIAGIGVVTPGNPHIPQTINFDNKQRSIPIDFAPPPIKDYVQETTGLPTFVANATDGAALAESWYGVAKNVESIIYLTIGTGVKAGMVVDGQPYPNLDEFTPEFGHTTINVDGPPCWCGNRGCLELYSSKNAILGYAIEEMRKFPLSLLSELISKNYENLTVNQVFKAAKNDDLAAKMTVAHLIKYLGVGAVNLINLYNPDLILIGTREMPVEDLDILIEPIQQMIRERCIPTSFKNAIVGIGSFGGDAYMMGAITIVSKELFTPSTTPSVLLNIID
jgi:predicted NBD/HSP70 family sugar kinase